MKLVNAMNLKPMLLLFLLGCVLSAATAKEIMIKTNNCIYSITPPQGWGEIPTDSITEHFKGVPFDAGLHNSINTRYFAKSYLQYVFLKSQESLNQFSFIEIAKEAQKSIDYTINNPEVGDNTFKVIKYKIDEEQQLFFMQGTISNKDKTKHFLQVMKPSKHGYIKAMLYSPFENEIPLSYVEVAGTVKVYDEYKYVEPKQGEVLNVKNVVFAVLLSLLVFAIIQFIPKIKQMFTRKQ